MIYIKSISSIFMIPLSCLLMGCSANSESKGTRALFDTREEAEKHAKSFNCTGAHQMGEKWMPCESHEAHQGGEQTKKDDGHHHHH